MNARTMLGGLAVAGVALAGAVTAAAPAAAAPAAGEVCHSAWKPLTTTPLQSTAEWTRNAPNQIDFGCGYDGRTHLHCEPFSGGRYLNEYGGKVTGDNVKDTAKCPTASVVIKAGWKIYYPSGALTSWYYNPQVSEVPTLRLLIPQS